MADEKPEAILVFGIYCSSREGFEVYDAEGRGELLGSGAEMEEAVAAAERLGYCVVNFDRKEGVGGRKRDYNYP